MLFGGKAKVEHPRTERHEVFLHFKLFCILLAQFSIRQLHVQHVLVIINGFRSYPVKITMTL